MAIDDDRIEFGTDKGVLLDEPSFTLGRMSPEAHAPHEPEPDERKEKPADRCLPLAELHVALQGDPGTDFWHHLRRCPRCTNAAITLDPDVMLTQRDDQAKQATVIDPALYRDKVAFKRGGMYQTWTAVDRRLGRKVVIKGLPSELDEPDIQKRQLLQACLQREAHILAKLSHPSIVTVLEAGEWKDGEAFYTTELVEGDNLSDAIRKRATLQDRLELLPAFASIVDAVAYAHRSGIVHRDLSPYNIIVGKGSATLIDWTTAKRTRPEHGREAILDAAEMKEEGTLTLASWGTPGFAPPEQREQDGHDHRVDIFTLGATLHFLITGRRPFDGETVDEILDNVKRGHRVELHDCPPPLASIIDKAMHMQPDARYPSADALAEDLRRFQAEQLVLAHEYTALEQFAHSLWFKPILAALVMTVIGLGAFFLVMAYERREEILRAEANEKIETIATSSQRDKEQMRATIEEMSVEASEQVRKAFEDKERSETARRTADGERLAAVQAATMAMEATLRSDEERSRAEGERRASEEQTKMLQKRVDELLSRLVEKDLKIAAAHDEIDAIKAERARLIAQNADLQGTLGKLTKSIDALQAAIVQMQAAQQVAQQAANKRAVQRVRADDDAAAAP
ncbi:MAG: protein kinase [Deltaproteobacteria bacterium]|nr:protein kinase [Deltaproteobacteria bacterium]